MMSFSKRWVLFCLLWVSLFAWGQDVEEDSPYEPVDMTIVFDKAYRMVIPSLYIVPNTVYLPVTEFFDFVKVPYTSSKEGQVVKGYFEVPSNNFELNFVDKFATFKGKRLPIEKEDAVMDIGFLYLKSTFMEKLFGFKMQFNERALAFQFTSTFELPLFKIMKQEKLRENLRISGSEKAVYDTTLERQYHWFRGEMMDWSIASSQGNSSPFDTRLELGGGAEILGGETNVRLNYSTDRGLVRNQQNYSWRWADNQVKFLRQVQLGRIYNNTIASVLSPVDGFVLTNTPTTLRKALGEYVISDMTEPDWVIELYLNNQLVSYTRSDASGHYQFKIPIVYGISNVTLRFYGTNGEIRSEQRTYNMPYNMLPKGEFEYRLSGGAMLDSTAGKVGRLELNYGINHMLTVGTGMEYLSKLVNNSTIPFWQMTFQPYSRLLMTAEYAHKVRTRFSFNYSLPKNIVLDGLYSRYVKGQDAIIYNYLEERALGVSLPWKMTFVSNNIRASFRQNVYTNFTYNSGELMWSSNYRNYNLIFSNYLNQSANNVNMYANLTLGMRLPGEANIRTSAQYNYMFSSLISLRLEMDKKLFSNGYGSVKLENNFLAGGPSCSMSFRYEFPYMTTNSSLSMNKKQFQVTESASGSFAFNSGDGYVYADRKNAVGRSGIAFSPFIDANFNGVRDPGEKVPVGLRVRANGGQVLNRENDSIIRIVGLEPFVDYNIQLDESGFDNVAWRLPAKSMKIVTDPNQFKKIELKVSPMAEISGMVADENGKGIGRVIVRVADSQGNLISRTLTESDGYFSHIGYKPGDYKLFVDSVQLSILKYKANPVYVTVLENPDGDVVDAGVIELVKQREAQTRKVRKALPGGGYEVIEIAETDTTSLQPYVKQEAMEEDTLELFAIYFDVNKVDIKPTYFEKIRQLANYLNKPNHELLGVDIQGHTDSDASEIYNLYLSNRRAAAVKERLIMEGVREERLKISAFGKTKQLTVNVTKQDKAYNRRVIFKPINKDDEAERPLEEMIKEVKPESILVKPIIDKPAILPPDKTMIRPDQFKKNLEDSSGNKVGNALWARKFLNLGVQANPEALKTEMVRSVPEWCLMYKKGNQYWFQVAAFKSQLDAMRLGEQVKKILPNKTMLVSQGEWVKVQVGFYSSKEAALKDAALLRLKGVKSR